MSVPKALVVNLFGGPGTGKSTTASGVFERLKTNGTACELVHEFAKDLTWEGRDEALNFQPYIFGKQAYHVHRLINKTRVIITDSPILLSSHIYSRPFKGYSQSGLMQLGLETFNGWNTLNFFLERNLALHPFVAAGRNQDEAESVKLDVQIKNMLERNNIVHYTLPITKAGPHRHSTANKVVELVNSRLEGEKQTLSKA